MKKVYLLFFSFIVFTTLVNACSCIPPLSVEESREISDAVFVGRVTNIEVSNLNAPFIGSNDPVTVSFETLTSFKGDIEETQIVTTARDSASCGFNFEEERVYLVYATEDDNTLRTNICTRTKLIEAAQNELEILKPYLEEPLPDKSVQYKQGNVSINYILILAIITIILIIVLWIVLENIS